MELTSEFQSFTISCVHLVGGCCGPVTAAGGKKIPWGGGGGQKEGHHLPAVHTCQLCIVSLSHCLIVSAIGNHKLSTSAHCTVYCTVYCVLCTVGVEARRLREGALLSRPPLPSASHSPRTLLRRTRGPRSPGACGRARANLGSGLGRGPGCARGLAPQPSSWPPGRDAGNSFAA